MRQNEIMPRNEITGNWAEMRMTWKVTKIWVAHKLIATVIMKSRTRKDLVSTK